MCRVDPESAFQPDSKPSLIFPALSLLSPNPAGPVDPWLPVSLAGSMDLLDSISKSIRPPSPPPPLTLPYECVSCHPARAVSQAPLFLWLCLDLSRSSRVAAEWLPCLQPSLPATHVLSSCQDFQTKTAQPSSRGFLLLSLPRRSAPTFLAERLSGPAPAVTWPQLPSFSSSSRPVHHLHLSHIDKAPSICWVTLNKLLSQELWLLCH